MDINFDYKADPLGGHISNYLLEKARVVSQQAGERNFHVFYQLMSGGDSAQLKGLHLDGGPGKFVYTCEGGPENYKVKGMDDKKNFQAVVKAMEVRGEKIGKFIRLCLNTLFSVDRLFESRARDALASRRRHTPFGRNSVSGDRRRSRKLREKSSPSESRQRSLGFVRGRGERRFDVENDHAKRGSD